MRVAASPGSLVSPLLVLLIIFLLSGSLVACGGSASPSSVRPPIILLTCEGLPAASVGSGFTPALDAFSEEADWAGRGVASSGRARPAAASLVTGLNPWRHQVLRPGDRLSPRLLTLAEALSSLGYHASGYIAGSLNGPRGFQQGFDFFRTLHQGRGARSHLRSLQGGPELVWIHLQHPSPPWIRRDWLFPEGEPPPGLPRRITGADLAPYRRPGVEPPEAMRLRFQALYRNNVALADVLLGRFLEDLRGSGHWDEVLVVVTATHGQELGNTLEDPLAGGLSRRMLEVPLVIKLPRNTGLQVVAPQGARVGTTRLFATLVEAAGGTPAAGVAPSLFRQPAEDGVLSELYAERSENRLSWLHGEYQLLWRRRLEEPNRFDTSLPLDGAPDGADERLLLRWTETGVEPVSDPERSERLASELRRGWSTFLSAETSPARASAGLFPRP